MNSTNNYKSLALQPDEIYYRVYGDEQSGSPLVLLHGLMGYASNWGKIWPHFAKARPVLVFDQRGHGRTAKPKDGYSPSHYAADLISLLDHLGWDKIHLCGHSMGGRVAMQFAASYPERILSLTLEDSGPLANVGVMNWIENLLGRVPVPFSTREGAKEFFETKFLDDPLVGSFLHANIERKADDSYDWRFSVPAMLKTLEFGRSVDSSEIFRSIQCPILLFRGGKSAHLSVEEVERMRGLNPHLVQVHTVPQAGHFVHPTAPDEFNHVLAAFIDGL